MLLWHDLKLRSLTFRNIPRCNLYSPVWHYIRSWGKSITVVTLAFTNFRYMRFKVFCEELLPWLIVDGLHLDLMYIDAICLKKSIAACKYKDRNWNFRLAEKILRYNFWFWYQRRMCSLVCPRNRQMMKATNNIMNNRTYGDLMHSSKTRFLQNRFIGDKPLSDPMMAYCPLNSW